MNHYSDFQDDHEMTSGLNSKCSRRQTGDFGAAREGKKCPSSWSSTDLLYHRKPFSASENIHSELKLKLKFEL